MFPDRLTLPGFVFAISGACMSICLTNIASMTAWTCDFVNNTAGDLIWDFCLEGTDKCSNFPNGDDWENWCFDVEQGFYKGIGDGAPVLDLKQMLGGGFLCGTVLVLSRLLLNWSCINLLEGFLDDGIVEGGWILVFVEDFFCTI